MTRTLIFTFLFIGSTAGSYLPLLWGGSVFSMESIFLSAIGGFIGIYFGYKLSKNF